jgi:phosphoribosylglycinamide formyltransferase-1
MKLCWFTTGRDKEALTLIQDVYKATEEGIIDGEITLLFMNREREESIISDKIISFAEERQIPIELLSSKRFFDKKGLKITEGRAIFDSEIRRRLERYDFDLIFLAGYMLILSNLIFEPYLVLNLHPSLPNAYKGRWEDVMRKTVEDGERQFGAMVHIVNELLDEGPCVSYAKLSLEGGLIEELYNNVYRGDSTSRDFLCHIMRNQEFAIETPLLSRPSLCFQGELTIVDKKVYFRSKEVKEGVDITEGLLTP